MVTEQDISPQALRLKLRHKAMDLLARREHSRSELVQKLRQREFPVSLIAEELDRLQQEKLLSEERFIEQYIHSRARKGFGPRRIQQELRQKGISKQRIDTYLTESDRIWTQRAAIVQDKRYGAHKAENFSERVKQIRFLEHRGFTPEQIETVLGSDKCVVQTSEQNF